MLNCFGFQYFSSQSLFWSILVNRREQKRSRPRVVVGLAAAAAGRRTGRACSRQACFRRRRSRHHDWRRRAPPWPLHPRRSGSYLSFTLAGSSLGPRGGLFAVGACRGLERAGDSHLALAHRAAHPCLRLPYRPLPVHSACCPDGHACCCQHPSSFSPTCTRQDPTGSRCYSRQSSFGHIGAWPCTLRPPGRGARALLVLGATGLLYAHYFGALLLPALALFHLFFVRKERRWWQPVALLGLATLLALPQVPDLLIGIEFNRANEQLHASALHYPEVTSLFLRYLSNGLLDVRQPVSNLLALALPLPLLFYGRRNRYRRQTPGVAWYLLLTSILLLLLLLGTNEWLQVLRSSRIRYLAALWPPAVLLISHTFCALRALQTASPPGPPGGIVLIVLMAFLGTSDYLGRR